MLEQSDIISFHNYDDGAKFEQCIQWLQRFNRPILCTEYMARGNKSTFESLLPIARKYNVAAMIRFRWSSWLLWVVLAGGQPTFAQGVAVPNRPNRPQPKAKLSLPLPKVQFEDIVAKAGLGKATSLERIEVVWPGGKKEVFTGLKANRVHVLEEGKGAASEPKPAAGKRK